MASRKSNPGYIRHKLLLIKGLCSSEIKVLSSWFRTLRTVITELSFAIANRLLRTFRIAYRNSRNSNRCAISLIRNTLQEVSSELVPLLPEEKGKLEDTLQLVEDVIAIDDTKDSMSTKSEDNIDESLIKESLVEKHLPIDSEVPPTTMNSESSSSKRNRRRKHKKAAAKNDGIEDLTKKYGLDGSEGTFWQEQPISDDDSDVQSTVSSGWHRNPESTHEGDEEVLDLEKLARKYHQKRQKLLNTMTYGPLRQLYVFLLRKDPTQNYSDIMNTMKAIAQYEFNHESKYGCLTSELFKKEDSIYVPDRFFDKKKKKKGQKSQD